MADKSSITTLMAAQLARVHEAMEKAERDRDKKINEVSALESDIATMRLFSEQQHQLISQTSEVTSTLERLVDKLKRTHELHAEYQDRHLELTHEAERIVGSRQSLVSQRKVQRMREIEEYLDMAMQEGSDGKRYGVWKTIHDEDGEVELVVGLMREGIEKLGREATSYLGLLGPLENERVEFEKRICAKEDELRLLECSLGENSEEYLENLLRLPAPSEEGPRGVFDEVEVPLGISEAIVERTRYPHMDHDKLFETVGTGNCSFRILDVNYYLDNIRELFSAIRGDDLADIKLGAFHARDIFSAVHQSYDSDKNWEEIIKETADWAISKFKDSVYYFAEPSPANIIIYPEQMVQLRTVYMAMVTKFKGDNEFDMRSVLQRQPINISIEIRDRLQYSEGEYKAQVINAIDSAIGEMERMSPFYDSQMDEFRDHATIYINRFSDELPEPEVIPASGVSLGVSSDDGRSGAAECAREGNIGQVYKGDINSLPVPQPPVFENSPVQTIEGVLTHPDAPLFSGPSKGKHQPN